MNDGQVRRVLIAVDDSTESLEAARTGARFAAEWKAAVRAINVRADETVDAAAADALVAYVLREIRRNGVDAARSDAFVRVGEPFRRILDEAAAWPADLIVMAVRNRVGVRSPYVGSATEHVLEFASCPVLVIPPRTEHR